MASYKRINMLSFGNCYLYNILDLTEHQLEL